MNSRVADDRLAEKSALSILLSVRVCVYMCLLSLSLSLSPSLLQVVPIMLCRIIYLQKQKKNLFFPSLSVFALVIGSVGGGLAAAGSSSSGGRLEGDQVVFVVR